MCSPPYRRQRHRRRRRRPRTAAAPSSAAFVRATSAQGQVAQGRRGICQEVTTLENEGESVFALCKGGRGVCCSGRRTQVDCALLSLLDSGQPTFLVIQGAAGTLLLLLLVLVLVLLAQCVVF